MNNINIPYNTLLIIEGLLERQFYKEEQDAMAILDFHQMLIKPLRGIKKDTQVTIII